MTIFIVVSGMTRRRNSRTP